MNRFELIKAEADLATIGQRLAAYAEQGWEAIPKDDVERLKVWGVALRQRTPGYFMIRVRIPAGRLSSAQAITLSNISRRYGRGTIDLTARCQAQLRWLRIEHIPDVLDALKAAGLLTVQTLMDSVRNVIGCPLAGLTEYELFDATEVIRRFDELVAGRNSLINLPRKLNIAITGCTCQCCQSTWQDVSLVAATRRIGGANVAGFNVLAGGKISGGDCHAAQPLDVFVTPEQAPGVLLAIAETYRDHGLRESRAKARLVYLLQGRGWAWMRGQIEQRVGTPLQLSGIDRRTNMTCPLIGLIRQADCSRCAVGLHVPSGRLTAEQLEGLAALATRDGDGTLRLTTDQTVILPNIPLDRTDALLGEPLLRELPYNPHPIITGLVSCTGLAQCSLAVIDSKPRAAEVAAELARRVPPRKDAPPIRIHWSGCRAGCGRHAIADIGLVGRKAQRGSEVVEAVDVYLGGSGGPDAVTGIKVLEAVPCDELPDALEPIVRYGVFDKLRKQLLLRGGAINEQVVDAGQLNQHGVAPLMLQTLTREGRTIAAF